MEANVIDEEGDRTEKKLSRHASKEGNDDGAYHKCQLCNKSFIERLTLDKHVEQCDPFIDSTDTRKRHQISNSDIKKSDTYKSHDEKVDEKGQGQSRYGKGFYEIIVKENVEVKSMKGNIDAEIQLTHANGATRMQCVDSSKENKLKSPKCLQAGKDIKMVAYRNVSDDITESESAAGATCSKNVSKSGRKRKIKSFDDYETDFSFIKGPTRTDKDLVKKITAECTGKVNEYKEGNDIEDKNGAGSDLIDSSNTTAAVIYLCPVCSEVDEDIGNIQTHIKLQHDQEQLSWEVLTDKCSKMGGQPRDAATRVLKKQKVLCPFCNENCQTSEQLRLHVKSFHECPLVCCGICQLPYASRKTAVLHMKKCHFKSQHICIDCKEGFTTNQDLIKHRITLHQKQTQSKMDLEIEGNKRKHSETYEMDDVAHEHAASEEPIVEMKTEEFKRDEISKVLSSKTLNNRNDSNVLKQMTSSKQKKTTVSCPIIIKSARVMPKAIDKESKKSDDEIRSEEVRLTKGKTQCSNSELDVSDLEEEDIGDEILSDFDNEYNEEQNDNQNPKCRIDFSKIKDVKYKCCYDYCGSVLQNFGSWKTHIVSHLTNKKNDSKYAPLQCIECGYSTKLKPVFIQHLLTKHSLLESVQINLEHCQILDKKSSEQVKIITCVFCCLTMDSRHFLAQHECFRKKVHFYCPFCKRKDSRFENMQEHIKEDHSDETIHRKVLGEKFQSLRTAQHDPAYSINNTDTECSICNQEFQTNDELKGHVNEIHAAKPFSCGVCRQCYGRYCAVKDHMKKTHSLPMACQYCKRGFGDKADLARHEATHLKTKPFQCDLCSVRFSDQKGLTVHQRFKHTECSTPHSDQKALTSSGTESRQDTFICDICGLTLYTQLQYRNHAKNHKVVNQDRVTQINCEICFQNFTSRKTYRRHLCTKSLDASGPQTFKGQSDSVQSVRDIFEKIKQNPTPGTDAVVQCGLCQKNFSKNKYLFNHIRHVHLPNEGKKFHCNICRAGFARKAQLQCHIRSHTKTKPYMCKICRKQFRQLGHVKVHLLSHSAKSVFNCELCAQVFKTKDTLKSHIYKHCDVNPYKCFITSCDRSFVSFNNLVLHVRNCDNSQLPDKSFECKLCSNVKLEDIKTGLAHMKSHSKDAFYKCSICSQDFTAYRALYNHKAKLKHFTESEIENGASQAIHTQNFKTEEVNDDIDMAELQEQYEFTPDTFELQEMHETCNPESSDHTVAEEDEENRVIDTEELMDIAEQLTHMAQGNVLSDENLEVKIYENDGNSIVESVETVIEDYNGGLFVAPAVEMSVQTSKYSNQYNPLTNGLTICDDTNLLNADLLHGRNKDLDGKITSSDAPDLKFSQEDDRDLTVQYRSGNNFIEKDDYHIEVLASHPVIDESAVLVSKTFHQKKRLTSEYNTGTGVRTGIEDNEIQFNNTVTGRDDYKMLEFSTEAGRDDEKIIETPAVVNDEIQQGIDTVCVEMLTIPTIYDEQGREVKVNVINEEGHEIPIQNNPELLQALLTTGNYSLGSNLSDFFMNKLAKDSMSDVKESQDLQRSSCETELESSDFNIQNNTEIYVINEVQNVEDQGHSDATNKIFTANRRAKKQKANISSSDRNIDNVPGEITDMDTSVSDGNVNYKVKLNYYEDRTKNKEVYHLKCDVCSRRFSRLKDLNHHKKIHLPNDEKQFKCKQCGKGYTSKKTLFSHMLIHSGDRPHKCSHCDKSFRQLGHLQTHLRIHTNYRPFKCINCEKTFATNSQLKKHVQKHGVHFNQGLDNCVACLICGNSFADEKHLKIHKLKHISVEAQNELIKNYNAVVEKKETASVEKSLNNQHMCDVCGQLFNSLSNFKYHKEIHLQEHKQACTECGNEFLTKKRLQVHINQVHSSGNRWQCDLCGISFKLRTSLNTHVRHIHKDPKYQCTKCNQEFHRRYVFLQHLPLCIGEEILQQGQ